MSSLQIWVNDRAHTLPAASTLAALIAELGHAPESVATALNGCFVARDERDAQALVDGDHVTCFQAIVGG